MIRDLDLTTVKNKLASKKSWWWNSWNDIDKLELEYKQFLYLIAINSDKMVVPWTQDLDDLWHEHILDTQKYADDCQKIFGKFIHHNPHVPKGSSKHSTAFNDTKKMYKEAFKEKADKKKSGSSGSGCGAGCGSTNNTVIMPVVFCGSASSHSSGSSCSSGTSGGSSCSTSSCSSGSSCGSSCGGGGCGGGCSS